MSTTKCYGIDGEPYATFDRYIPCNGTSVASGGHSSCCAPGDNCLTNGLCQGQRDNLRQSNLFWRNGCTDPTWSDPACPKFCKGLGKRELKYHDKMLSELTFAGPTDSHGVFYCLKDDKWCCPTGGFDGSQALNTTCCSRTDLSFTASDPLVFTIAAVNMVATMSVPRPSATLTGALSSFIAATASPTPTHSSQNAPASSSPPATNSKIDLYVALPLGILLAIALGIIFWLVKRNRKPTQEPADDAVRMTDIYAQEKELPRYELESRPTELSDNKIMAPELATSRWSKHEY
jgi:hypothetical protein